MCHETLYFRVISESAFKLNEISHEQINLNISLLLSSTNEMHININFCIRKTRYLPSCLGIGSHENKFLNAVIFLLILKNTTNLVSN